MGRRVKMRDSPSHSSANVVNVASGWGGQIILNRTKLKDCNFHKGWLAIAKLKPLSLFISLFLILEKEFDNVKIEK